MAVAELSLKASKCCCFEYFNDFDLTVIKYSRFHFGLEHSYLEQYLKEFTVTIIRKDQLHHLCHKKSFRWAKKYLFGWNLMQAPFQRCLCCLRIHYLQLVCFLCLVCILLLHLELLIRRFRSSHSAMTHLSYYYS